MQLESQPTPELSELSSHVNEMVKSILSTTNKLSVVLDTVQLPIGVYEYGPGMKQVMVTRRMGELFGLDEKEAELLFSDVKLFKLKLDEVQSNPLNEEKTIFRIPGEHERFIQIESFEYEKNTLGIVLDVTRMECEKRTIERERDIDLLTELYTRRALYSRLDALFQREGELKHAALIMLDADNLKQVNDRYGHEDGDRYLRAIADVLKQGSAQKIAARLSGDEFVVFLYGYEKKEVLEQAIGYLLAERDTRHVELRSGKQIKIGFSAGYVFYPEEETELIRMMKRADERMYEEKKSRKEKAGL